MKKYSDEFIKKEITRCKNITGTPTTIRQLVKVSPIDIQVFIRYLNKNPDADILVGEAASLFNKKIKIETSKKTKLERYGDPQYNNRNKLKFKHYQVEIKEEIEIKIKEIGKPITSRYLAEFLPYSHYLIENYSLYFNINGVLHGEEAKKFNNEMRIHKIKLFNQEHPGHRKRAAEKSMKTKEERYGDPNYNNTPKNIEGRLDKLPAVFADMYYDRDKSINFLKNFKFQSREDIVDYFNLSTPIIENWIYRNDLIEYAPKLGAVSKKELELRHELECIGFTSHNVRSVLNSKEIDIFNIDKKIAIEFNGNYWHSNLKLPKSYHYNKSVEAESLGIRLIHVYEYEWDNPTKKKIILSLIKSACGLFSRRIYARKCSVREITNKQARDFNNNNHLQGHRNAKITYGLFYENELVQLMSFSKTKYNRNIREDDSWEIIRECTSINTLVVGGVSKLYKYFLKNNIVKSIFSYCDFNKFTGESYEKLGMKFIGYTGPDMKWLLCEGREVVNRSPHRHKELKEKAESCIWGAGSKKYIQRL